MEEPGLTDGSMVDVSMRDFIKAGMQSLVPRSGANG